MRGPVWERAREGERERGGARDEGARERETYICLRVDIHVRIPSYDIPQHGVKNMCVGGGGERKVGCEWVCEKVRDCVRERECVCEREKRLSVP
jgi:hypothetical protein